MIDEVVLAMRRYWWVFVAAMGAFAGAAMAQSSPYAGEGARVIKSLSAQQIADLRAGRGMGLALAAELNRYPGPLHVLELADKLTLTVAQRARVQGQLEQMRTETIGLGEQLIAAEAALDQLFATRAVSEVRLNATTDAIGAIQARLRAAHLRYHLRTTEVLTSEQIVLYVRLRGYEDARPVDHPHRH